MPDGLPPAAQVPPIYKQLSKNAAKKVNFGEMAHILQLLETEGLDDSN